MIRPENLAELKREAALLSARANTLYIECNELRNDANAKELLANQFSEQARILGLVITEFTPQQNREHSTLMVAAERRLENLGFPFVDLAGSDEKQLRWIVDAETLEVETWAKAVEEAACS